MESAEDQDDQSGLATAANTTSNVITVRGVLGLHQPSATCHNVTKSRCQTSHNSLKDSQTHIYIMQRILLNT